MRLSTKIAYNTIIQIISKFAATILGLVAAAVMARYLGQVGFGQYTIIITFLSFFGILADLGLTLVTTQMISHPDIDREKILSNLFALRLFSALFFLGLACAAVLFFPYEWPIKVGVMIMAVSFFFASMNQIVVGLFQNNLRMDKVSIAEVASRLALAAGVVIAARLRFGLLGMVGATVASSAVSFFLHYWFAGRYVRLKLAFDKDVWLAVFRKSWPIAITIFFNLIYLKADTFILSLIKTQAEVGIYGAAYKVIDVLITIPFMLAGIILPILTSAWSQKEPEQFNKTLQRSFDVLIMLAVPLAVGAHFISSEIMTAVAGREFALSGDVLRILIFAAAAIFAGCMFAHAVIAIDKQKKIIGAYVFTAITSLIGYLVFIPKYSYFGAAWMTIYSETAIALASFYVVWKYTRFFPRWKIFWQSLAASIAMGAVIWLYRRWTGGIDLIAVFSLACLVYFLFLYILGGIKKRDIVALLNR